MTKHRRPHGRVSNDIHHNKPGPTKPTGPSPSTNPAKPPTKPTDPSPSTNPAKPANPARSASAIRSSPNSPEADDVSDDRDGPDGRDASDDHDAPDNRDAPDDTPNDRDASDDRDGPGDRDASGDHDAPDDRDDVRDLPGYLDPDSSEFDPAKALQSLHLDIVELDALVNAADEAVAHVPPPGDREGRCASDRAIALVTKVTEGSRALARRSYEMQDALTALTVHHSRRRAES
jgi:hypothetical protein